MGRKKKKQEKSGIQSHHDLKQQAGSEQTASRATGPEIDASIKAKARLRFEKKQRRRHADNLLRKLYELSSDSNEYRELLVQLFELKDVLPDVLSQYKNSSIAKIRADAELLYGMLATPGRLEEVLDYVRRGEFHQIRRREILSGLEAGRLIVPVPINECGPSFGDVTSLVLQYLKEATSVEELDFEALELQIKPSHMRLIHASLILFADVVIPLQIIFVPAVYDIPADLESDLAAMEAEAVDGEGDVLGQIEQLLSAAKRQEDVLGKVDVYSRLLKFMLDQGYSKTEEFARVLEERRKLQRPREIAARLQDQVIHLYVDIDEKANFLLPLTEQGVLPEVARIANCDANELSLDTLLPNQLGRYVLLVRMGQWKLTNVILDLRASKQRFESPREASDYYFSQALVHREKRDYDRARFFFEKALTHDPSIDVYLRYAVMERGLRNFDRERNILERGLRRYPDGIKLYEDYGQLERRERNFAKAVEIYNTAASRMRGRPQAFFHRLLGETLMETGGKDNYQKARQHFETARRLDPNRFHKHKRNVFLYRLATLYTQYTHIVPTIEFLKQADFEVVDILELHKQRVDLLIQPLGADYGETYNLVLPTAVRHFSKTPVTHGDVEQLIRQFRVNITAVDINQEVIFVVLQDESRIRDNLYQRIENPRESLYILPIEENEIAQALKDSNSSGVMRNILANWLGRRDLYQANAPVRGRHFFGREQPLRELVVDIDSGNHVGIFGLRKVGKTSFLLHLLERQRHDIAIFLDLQRVPVPDCRYLYMEISNQLADEIGKKYPQLLESINFTLAGEYDRYRDLPSDNEVRARFDDDLRAVRSQLLSQPELSQVQILLLLDEAEIMLPGGGRPGFKGYLDFFTYLRGLSQQDNCLVSVIAAANPAICEEAQWGGQDNPVFGFYHKTFLPPLEQNECNEMVTKLGQGMGISYTPGSLEEIYRNTGGHPFITRQLCSAIIRIFDTRPLLVDEAKIGQGIQEYIFSEATVFQEIVQRLDRDFPLEKEILMVLAAAEGPVNFKELSTKHGIGDEDALRHLAGYQLIERLEDAYQLKIGLLRRWLREKWLDLEG